MALVIEGADSLEMLPVTRSATDLLAKTLGDFRVQLFPNALASKDVDVSDSRAFEKPV